MLIASDAIVTLRHSYAQDKQTLLEHTVRQARRSAVAVHTTLLHLTQLADTALHKLWQLHGLDAHALCLGGLSA